MERDDFIKKNILATDSKGRVRNRERNDLEYKVSFGLNSWANYAKTMAAFANNIGGYIIFGVKDNPREIVGVNNGFNDFKQERLTESLNQLFTPELIWEAGTVEVGDKTVGYIYTYESEDKPIIAQKSESSEKIASGDVFYRYRARNEKIRFPEMKKIIDERTKREQERIFKLMETIKNSNTTNLGIVNYNSGHFTTPDGIDVAVDKRLVIKVLKQAKYIKNGTFVENGGQPVIRVTGDIDLSEPVEIPDTDPNISHPYLQKELAVKLGIDTQAIYALIWLFEMKGQRKYHIAIKTSKKTVTHKFSEIAYKFLKDKLDDHKDGGLWLETVKKQFNQRNKSEGKKNGK